MQTTLPPPRKKNNKSVLSIGRKGLYLKRSLLKKISIGAYVKFCAAVIAILGLTPYNK